MVSKILIFALMLLLFVFKLSFVIKAYLESHKAHTHSGSRCLDAALSQKYLH